MKKFLPSIFSLVIVCLLLPSYVAAQDFVSLSDTPSFPSCSAPSGSVLANHSEGVHGIVGDFGAHTGSDVVYSLSNNNATQCFCPTDGIAGVQTNWMNASGLSSNEIASFTSAGWIYVVNGIVWGLSDNPYLAKNISFVCSAVGGGDGSIGSYGAGGGSEEQVLGISTSHLKLKDPGHSNKPKVAGIEIAVLPATGFQYIPLFVVAFVYSVATAIAIRF